jgi:hypothetical protein
MDILLLNRVRDRSTYMETRSIILIKQLWCHLNFYFPWFDFEFTVNWNTPKGDFMKNMQVVTTLLLWLLSDAAFAIGFSNGNDLKTQKLSGTAFVQCFEDAGYDVRYVSCTSDQLFPDEFDRYVGDKFIDADHVQISNESMKGKKNVQKRIYNPKNMTSRNFNLWVSTLTQSPLLKSGENKLKVSYLLKKKVVAEDRFVTNVTKAQDLKCDTVGINYGNLRCPTDMSVCRDYFRTTTCR